MESGDDRRRGERVPINDEFAPLGDVAGNTWVSDLSLGGVFVHTEDLLSVGSLIDLRFTILLDDPVVIEAFARVARHSHKPRGMGVEFTAMTDAMTGRIEQVLARRRPLDSGEPLRLPEPSGNSKFIGIPIDDDDGDDAGTTLTRPRVREANPVVLARPAPVPGLDGRQANKREFEDAVTGAFPQLSSRSSGAETERPARGARARIADPDATTGVFVPVTNAAVRFAPPPMPGKPGAQPAPQAGRPAAGIKSARPRETKDDDRTQVYPAIPVDGAVVDED